MVNQIYFLRITKKHVQQVRHIVLRIMLKLKKEENNKKYLFVTVAKVGIVIISSLRGRKIKSDKLNFFLV